jgi:hypothetical protein
VYTNLFRENDHSRPTNKGIIKTYTQNVGDHEPSPCSESNARMVRLWYHLRSVQRLGHLHNSVLGSIMADAGRRIEMVAARRASLDE